MAEVALSFVVKGFQPAKQCYTVTLYAPFIYGLVQMVLWALFPVATL